jgi:glucose-6-phosphate isomerase
MPKLSRRPEWRALKAYARAMREVRIADLLAGDGERVARFTLELDDLLVDFSKQRVSGETMDLLHALAAAVGVEGWTRRLFAGEKINATEGRAALHVALRDRSGEPVLVDGADVMPEVRRVLDRMRDFAEAVRAGKRCGQGGRRFRSVVNIGIGGSDLGPAMVCEALSPWRHPELAFHFVSNVDGADIARVLAGLDPSTTLFVVTSKTFTTQETMMNAQAARAWLVEALGEDAVARNFVAVSTNLEKVAAFGIEPANTFGFWEWVGGRYSLWSAVGLPIALSVGFERFEALLEGAHAMDRHFREAPAARNLPVTLALLGIWNGNFLGAETHAVVPYSQLLRRFPAYLQQLEMESNGKRALTAGGLADYDTAPIVWGEPGTNGQHAFFQLLHQGTRRVPVDFIAAASGEYGHPDHHDALIANALAQSSALAIGRSEAEARAALLAEGHSAKQAARLAPHRTYPGGQPSTTILLKRLDPRSLGMLIALYEHKTFVQGIVWGIQSFDQWGVELGKQLAGRVLAALDAGKDDKSLDPSTRALLRAYRRWRDD